ncbi:hypothetical protein LNQ49_16465 [Flavobacterium sp. F-65]|uniref:Transmembrane protein n=1 Tax=Flavobacterium pisciphilum TaxID=2893755 RepID=A0ABS8MWK8_9FLAO|nr:hypothetical protein [Flavobacterium sp. F-65]MCC9073171.1 hypothetical protein [Flavobacterium sp. F-65]
MKKYFAITFWAIYMLFFAIPFPVIMYYVINSEFDVSTLKDKDPWLAISVLVLSVLLWLILLIGYFQKWILKIFITKRNLEKVKIKGAVREAKIIKAIKTSKPKAKFNTYELELSFKNLANTEITHKTTIIDGKPHERRFEAGKKISLILNRDMKQPPYFIIATTTATINLLNLALRILGWLLLLVIVIGYYFYSYQTESYGMGWRFMSFGHPLIVCPAVLLFYRFLARFIFHKLTGINDNSPLIKFKGIKTMAKLVKASQTGTYINEQPMIRFDVEYTDNRHHVHRGSLKKVIGLLELDITKQEQIEIFYLPENPSQIAFASDLNNIE